MLACRTDLDNVIISKAMSLLLDSLKINDPNPFQGSILDDFVKILRVNPQDL